MKITAGGDECAKFAGQNRQAANLLGGLHAIDHLERVPACRDKIRHQLAPFGAGEIVLPRMRQTDPRTGPTQRINGLRQLRPMLLDVTQFARAKPFTKRFGAVFDVACLHQKVGKMGPRRRITAVAQRLL